MFWKHIKPLSVVNLLQFGLGMLRKQDAVVINVQSTR